MRWSRRFALAWMIPGVFVACATSGQPLGGGGSGNGNGDDTDAGGRPTYGGDGGSEIPEGGAGLKPKSDGGSIASDSGTPPPPPVDSGAPAMFCTGTKSAYKDPAYGDNKYADWCDDDVYFQDTEIDCTTNSDCTGQFVDGDGNPITSCCYNPPSATLCYSDTSPTGTPQCVPQ